MHWIRRVSADPSCAMLCAGAVKVVVVLTDGILSLLCLREYERSRMVLYERLLWGICATGESLRFGGMLCLMSFHLKMRA